MTKRNNTLNVEGFGIRRTYTALLYELAFMATRYSVCLIWNREVPGSIPMVVGDRTRYRVAIKASS